MNAELAPEFPGSLQWINTEFDISLADQRGKVVIVFFWTYSNVNSILFLQALRAVETEHDSGVVILGVHCPKFSAEEDTETLLKAVNRHFIRFPVAQDVDYDCWNRFSVEAWPTCAVIDATGALREVLVGDRVGDELLEVVNRLMDEAVGRGVRDFSRTPIARKPEPSSLLRFPSGIVEARGLLYVADTGNNRVLEVAKEGRIQRVFGSGNPGFWDGSLDNCGFNMPRGLAYSDNYLYVADSNNHSIRRINLFNGEVETILGMGKDVLQMTASSRKARDFGIRYPIGLCFNGPDLYIAASGMHQIWRFDLGRGLIGWFSGSGQSGVVDGEPVRAAFAQPSGLAIAGNYLYVADSDGSAIREVRLQTGHVQTRSGKNAFAFGNSDGQAAQASLQYPMDVSIRPRSKDLWILDSFNNRVCILDLQSSELETVRVEHAMREPAAACLAGNTLWIANTNAHEVVRLETVSRKAEAFVIGEG